MADTARLNPDTRAAAWMGLSVFLTSWYPLVIALTGATVGPVAFQFWFNLTSGLVWFVYLMRTHPVLVGRRDIWVWIVRQLPTHAGVLAVVNGCCFAGFVWATLFIDAALVTVIAAAWLVLFVVYRKQHDKSNRYQRIPVQDWLLMGVAVVGVALVTLSQAGGMTGAGWRLLWGGLLAVASAVAASWMSFKFRLGTELYDRYRGTAEPAESRKDELACVLAVSIVADTAAMLMLGSVLIGQAILSTDPDGLMSIPVVWIIAVGTANALGSVAWRYANLETTNLGVNALQYLQPVLALVWLASFATVTVVRPDWLWVGAAAVIGANALIAFRSQDRAGVKQSS